MMTGLRFTAVRLGKLVLLASLASLGACASFDAHPAPVLSIANATNASGINVQDVLTRFYARDDSARGGLSPQNYRNMIVGTYLTAADLRFNEFRRHLSRQARGSNFGLDLGILGAAGGASIATGQRTANILSGIAAGLTGTRAALNRDVFFDRTLPAIFAAMDGARTEIRTSIMVNMRRSAEEYPLPVALADLANYENAGSLDSAIERVTGDAVNRSDEANRTYAAEVQNYSGPAEVGVRDIRVRIRERLFELAGTPAGTATLRQVATDLGLAPADDATAVQLRVMLQTKLQQTTDVAGTNDIANRLGLQ